MNISACMIVRNEEKHLRECLESLRFVDEVILVDTGSTDKTISIAKEFPNVKVFKKTFWERYYDKGFKKLFHYSRARNFSLDQATKDWILIIDADERVENPAHIGKLLEYDEVIAWRLDQMSIVQGISTPCSSTRLWRNGKGIRYEKIVHETVDEYLERNNLRVERCDARLIHVGFVDSSFNKEKALKVIEAIKYEKQPYMWYYLAIAYHQIGDVDNSVECFVKAVNSPMSPNIKAHAYAILGEIYRQSMGFYSDLADEMLDKSLELVPEQNLSHLIRAEKYKFQGFRNKALKEYKKLKDSRGSALHQDIILDSEKIKEYKCTVS